MADRRKRGAPVGSMSPPRPRQRFRPRTRQDMVKKMRAVAAVLMVLSVVTATVVQVFGPKLPGSPVDVESAPHDGEEVVHLALLRTCFSDTYGAHIPRMFQDFLDDLGQAYVTASAEASRNVKELTHKTTGEESSELGQKEAGAACDGAHASNGRRRQDGERRVSSAPVFHVTEYDVTSGQYPESWERFAGYMVPGGLASACGNEPWMVTLLHEAKELRESGRPVLGFCLGHQVMAQALGGRVRPRNDPMKHYALQESELLATPEGSVAADAISTAIAVLARNEGSDLTPAKRGKEYSEKEQTRLKLLYHHDDEAHPEFNYEYGRRVLDGILDADVEKGRLTQEMASRLKKQVLAWNHKEFPVTMELIRQLFDPIVPQRNGGSKTP